jgi:hypothetical protein
VAKPWGRQSHPITVPWSLARFGVLTDLCFVSFENLWHALIKDIKKTETGKATFDLYFHESSGNYVVVETYVQYPAVG